MPAKHRRVGQRALEEREARNLRTGVLGFCMGPKPSPSFYKRSNFLSSFLTPVFHFCSEKADFETGFAHDFCF